MTAGEAVNEEVGTPEGYTVLGSIVNGILLGVYD
jgi:hypothetical protein